MCSKKSDYTSEHTSCGVGNHPANQIIFESTRMLFSVTSRQVMNDGNAFTTGIELVLSAQAIRVITMKLPQLIDLQTGHVRHISMSCLIFICLTDRRTLLCHSHKEFRSVTVSRLRVLSHFRPTTDHRHLDPSFLPSQ